MAMNVQFLRGQSSKFKGDSFSPVATTFYYLEDTKELYLGSKLLSNEVTAVQFTELTNRVSAIETADFQSQINAILETLKSIATSDTVQAIDERLAEVEKDYLTSADKTELEGKITAHETAVNTKFEKYSTTDEMNAAIDADVKVVTDYIAANEAAWLAKTDISGLEQRMTAVEDVADAAQTAQEVSDAIDAKITALDLDNKYDAKDSAANALTEAKGYTDDKIDDLIKTYIDGDVDSVINTLEEVAAWINNDTAGVTKIIEDVATNAANIKTINESAVMTSGITAAKVGEYDTVKSTVDSNKSKWDAVENKLDASTYNTFVGSTYASVDAAVAAANSHADSKDADIAKGVDAQGRVATLESNAAVTSGITAAKVGEYDATKKTVDDNKAAWDAKLDTIKVGGSDGIAKDVKGFYVSGAFASIGNYMGSADFANIDLSDATKASLALAKTAVQPAAIANMATTDNVAAVQGEVDALEGVVAQNAQTCQNNFNTIVEQLTWGSF